MSTPPTAGHAHGRGRFWRMWGGPLLMALLTASGLVTALLSDTWGDWWSWVGLGVPTAAMGWYAWPRRAAGPPGPPDPSG